MLSERHQTEERTFSDSTYIKSRKLKLNWQKADELLSGDKKGQKGKTEGRNFK